MKKIIHYTKAFFCVCIAVILLYSCKKDDVVNKDSDDSNIPKITLKTTKAIGENFDIFFETKSNQDIWVDYGDGNKIKASHSATVKGDNIKIYYDAKLALSYLEFVVGSKITAIDLKNAIGLEQLSLRVLCLVTWTCLRI